MTLKTSLIITGDASVAKAEIVSLETQLAKLGTTGAGTTTTGLREAGDAARTLATDVAAARTAAGALSGTKVDLSSGFTEAAQAARTFGSDVATASSAFGAAQSTLGSAAAGATSAIVDQNAAIQALGQSVGGTIRSMLEQVSAGGSVMEAFDGHADALAQAFSALGAANVQVGASTQDAGTDFGALGDDLTGTAEKFTGMTGKAGALAGVIAGPLGAAFGLAVGALGPFVEELLNAESAEQAVSAASSELASYVDSLGNYFDTTTGKIKETNRQLQIFAARSAQARADEARKVVADAQGDIRETVANSARSRMTGGGGLFVPGAPSGNTLVRGSTALIDIGRANVDVDRKLYDLATSKDPAAEAAARVIEKRALIAKSLADGRKADAEARSYLTGVLDPSLRNPPSPGRTGGGAAPSTSPRSTGSEAGKAEASGQQAADRIAAITAAFDGTPPLIRQVGNATRQLDDLIDDLGRKKPINWEQTVADAQAAKAVVAEAINRPMDEYLRQADEASRLNGLLIAGRGQEAEAMRTVLQLERERGPLSEAQKNAVRDSVAARREEAAVLERVQRTQSLYLDGARGIAGTIDDATQAWVRGDLRSFLQTPAKLVDSFAQVKGRELFEGLFGEAFADLERALTEGPAEKAARAMAGELDDAGKRAADMGGALDRATPAIDTFVRSLSGGGSGAASQAQPAIDAYVLARFGRGAATDSGESVITGQRPDRPRMSAEQLFTSALSKSATSIADIFASKDTAGRIGAIIGEKATGAIKGASEGAAIAGVSNMLGIRMSGGGSQIGGALGALSGIPGGSIIGSILGGLVGNALTGPTRSGYASLGTDAGGTTITAISGGKNSEGRRTEAVGYANTVMDRLGQIAGSLGGTLAGGLNLGTIGTQGEKFVFDRDGAGSAEGIKVDSLQEAVAEALRNAVVEGAVTGVSEAVKRALGSGKDIERAVSEAGAVRALETSLGGIAGAIKQQCDDFASVAAERVRIAKGYGLDLLAVERKNAEDRNRIAEQLVKAQVGSLQSLIQQMTTGDLAEGSAMDKLAALDDAIVKAKADLREGVDGAGDVLAQLYQQRLSTTKDAYATTGQYAAERDRVLTEARAAIAQATARVDAGKGSDPALATTNAAITAGNQLTDEGNDILAEIRSEIRELTNLTRGAPQPRRDFVSMLELSRV